MGLGALGTPLHCPQFKRSIRQNIVGNISFRE
ncbi:hypothetical protein BDFB_012883 [Asbolus verrucosus]|uniref:Uncharacterized protein n=1 Tax=Asbolus verrucosus TaxID=1661398 RepID=A0A482VGE9_ASBVE|nr:hypothetical protein BDFB_012883 [Asbolus verrucosus]